MYLRMGNLTVRQFADRVNADFSDNEVEFLEDLRTDVAQFEDSNRFHIFDDPAISVVVGREAMPAVIDTFTTANSRRAFTREVSFYPATNRTIQGA